jgi:O-antigen/teichoic acid export membrane protein
MKESLMKEVSKNKQFIINMSASLISCVVGLAISFFISPLVINKLGFEAHSFVTMANNFVNYAAILAMALNSMAGRFITIKIHQNDTEGANAYFNSIMYANMMMAGILILPSILVVVFLERIVNISPELLADVRLLFAVTFLNFMVTIISTTFSTATFAVNRLDLSSMRTIESQLLKAVLLVSLFRFLPVNVSYIGIATFASNVYLFLTYIHYTKKLLPQITVSTRYFEWAKVLEILSAGIWNTVMRSGQVLTNQLDTYLSNLWIGKDEGGLTSTATTIANAINTLYETVAAVFTPSLTISFAKDNKDELISDLKSAMRMTGLFANIPLCFVIAFGIPFYQLWLPQKADSIPVIYRLTLLIMCGTLVGGAISPLFNVYTIVNKLKWNSLVTLFMGIANVIVVFILLQFPALHDYGLYFIAGVSSFLGIIKNLTFTPMYAAHCLGLPKKTFYPTIFKYMFVTVLMTGVFCVFNRLIATSNWFVLIGDVFLCGMTGLLMNYAILFTNKERSILQETVLKYVKR